MAYSLRTVKKIDLSFGTDLCHKRSTVQDCVMRIEPAFMAEEVSKASLIETGDNDI